MRKRTLGLLAALALCLVLLPGTALAEDGPVTITNADGSSPVTMEAGKKYKSRSGEFGGGIEEAADQENPGSDYLVYADGVLTACGTNVIYGTVSIASDLKMEGLSVDLCGRAGPALRLNGHTLTLSDGVRLQAHNQSVDGIPASANNCVFENGTIVGQGDVQIEINDYTTAAAVQDLTIKDVPDVRITGTTASGGVVENLTLENCGATILQRHESNSTVVEEGQITTDRLVSLGTLKRDNYHQETITLTGLVTEDGKIWADGGALAPYGPHFIESYVTTPTAYKAGEGCALYTPGDNDTGTPAKLTLDGASYNGTINIQQAKSVQLELKGTNEVKSVNTAALTLTGNGSFEGKLETGAFTNSSTAALNAVVIVSVPREGAGTAEFVSQTVYGNRKTSDINVSGVGVLETTALTIAAGAALTVDDMAPLVIYDFGNLTNKGTIVNEGDIQILLTEKPQGTPDFGTVVNNGVVTIYPVPAVDITGEEMSAFIKGLKLTGTGTVTVEKTVNGSTVTETYTNSGLKQLEPAGDRDGKLDLRDAAPTEEENAESWAKYGYKWTDVVKDETSGNITSAKLTLAPGFNAEKVVLPDATVEIETQGESTIGTLTPPELAPGNAPADKTNLTLSGLGPLNIQNHVEISGGQGNRLTVAEYARVQVTGGVTVGSSGAVDGLVTVNGTLIAAGGGRTALSSGNVVVGGSGTLKVSGTTGVSLAGKSDPDFHGALTIQPGGRLEADCTGNAVEVTTGSAVTFDDYEAGDILVFPSGYLPQDRQPRFNEDKTSLSIPGGRAFTISSDNVPTPPTPSHRHKWAEDWTTSATHHWHNCTASGCPVTADSEKNGYGQHAYDGGWDADCNVCGYTRSLSSSDSSGFSGSSSHGGGGSRPTSPITVEPSEHGTVTSDRSGAVYGGPVTLTVRPDSGYELESLTVTDWQGNKMKLSALGGGKYAFTMPGGAVTVRAAFTALEEENCPSRAFSDLDTGAWYHEAVDYVLSKGLMNGYADGTFRPNSALTRAQFVQILYNQAGRPAVTGRAPFTDVAPDAWCAPAVAWAAERGIAGGYGGGRFGPDEPVTREQLAVMLWRYAGSPAAAGQELDFSDADRAGGYAREALRWAVQTGVMNGKTGGVLDPKGFATRAQAASMLRNFMENG